MKKIIIILMFLFFLNCSIKKRQLLIIDIYLEDIEANDGQIQKGWKTVIELTNKSRDILNGKYGKIGDKFIMEYYDGYWFTIP
ncbi:MAG: hypothetical protein ACFFDN_05010 [Candidatus Hodarchaeota archaeon]